MSDDVKAVRKWSEKSSAKPKAPKAPKAEAPKYNAASLKAIDASKAVMKAESKAGMFRNAHKDEIGKGHEDAAKAHREAATANHDDPSMREKHEKTADHHEKMAKELGRSGSWDGKEQARDENGRFA